MDTQQRLEELRNSEMVVLGDEFWECIKLGIIFNPLKFIQGMHYEPMSASVIIHHWNHSRFLPLLFQSFESMDRNEIDLQFIIADSGSDDYNKEQVIKLVNEYKDKMKVLFISTDLSELRKEFNEKNTDGTFHGFPYISNMALDYCSGVVHMLCDSSNIVNKNWLRGLCSPHYIYNYTKLAIKTPGGNFTAESTLDLENTIYNEILFNLPTDYYGLAAGRGFGWSMKTEYLKQLGGFNQVFSCTGGVDDDLWYRMKLDDFSFYGHSETNAHHRRHTEGYEVHGRKPRWAYIKLLELYADYQQIDCLAKNINFRLEQRFLKPLFEFKNY